MTEEERSVRWGFRAVVTGFRAAHTSARKRNGAAQTRLWVDRLAQSCAQLCGVICSLGLQQCPQPHPQEAPCADEEEDPRLAQSRLAHEALMASPLLEGGLNAHSGAPEPNQSPLQALVEHGSDSPLLKWLQRVALPDATKTSAVGLKDGDVLEEGSEVRCLVLSRDQFGSALGVGGARLEATLHPATIKIPVARDWARGVVQWKKQPASRGSRQKQLSQPTFLASASCVTRDGKAYLFGGKSPHDKKSVYTFDGQDWSAHANLPRPSHGMSACELVDGRVLLVGGSAAQVLVYHTKKRLYEVKPNPQDVGWGTHCVVDSAGLVHVVGGSAGRRNYWTYAERANCWALAKQQLPKDLHCGGLVIDAAGVIYALGGRERAHKCYSLDTRAPVEGWKEIADMPLGGVSGFGCCMYRGRYALVVGGEKAYSEKQPTDTIMVYDTVENSWSVAKTRLPEPISGANAFVLDDALHVTGAGSPHGKDGKQGNGGRELHLRGTVVDEAQAEVERAFDVTDGDDGSYRLRLDGLPAGQYFVSILMDGQAIQGSPVTLVVAPPDQVPALRAEQERKAASSAGGSGADPAAGPAVKWRLRNRLQLLEANFNEKAWAAAKKNKDTARADKRERVLKRYTRLNAIKMEIDALSAALAQNVTFGGVVPDCGGRSSAMFEVEMAQPPQAEAPSTAEPSVHKATAALFAALLKHTGLGEIAQTGAWEGDKEAQKQLESLWRLAAQHVVKHITKAYVEEERAAHARLGNLAKNKRGNSGKNSKGSSGAQSGVKNAAFESFVQELLQVCHLFDYWSISAMECYSPLKFECFRSKMGPPAPHDRAPADVQWPPIRLQHRRRRRLGRGGPRPRRSTRQQCVRHLG